VISFGIPQNINDEVKIEHTQIITLFDGEPFTRSFVDYFGPWLCPVDPERMLFSVGKLGEKVSPHVVLCPESHGFFCAAIKLQRSSVKITRFRPQASHGFLGHVNRDRGMLVANHGYHRSVLPLVLHRLISRVHALTLSYRSIFRSDLCYPASAGLAWARLVVQHFPKRSPLGSFGNLTGGAKAAS